MGDHGVYRVLLYNNSGYNTNNSGYIWLYDGILTYYDILYIIYYNIYIYIYLVGGFSPPLWKIWVRQLGLLFHMENKKCSEPPTNNVFFIWQAALKTRLPHLIGSFYYQRFSIDQIYSSHWNHWDEAQPVATGMHIQVFLVVFLFIPF